MRQDKPKQHEKQILFEKILKVVKIKLQNDQKSIDKKLNKNRYININIINPQQNKSTNRIKISRPSPRESSPSSHYTQDYNKNYKQDQFQQVREGQILRQNAKNFVYKLRKQREENKGKFMILRLKEEQRKKSKQKELQEVKIKYLQSQSIKKMQKIIHNIMYHQSRVDYRLSQSLQRVERRSQIRSKTLNDNHSQVITEQKKQKIELPQVGQTRKILTNSPYLKLQENQ